MTKARHILSQQYLAICTASAYSNQHWSTNQPIVWWSANTLSILMLLVSLVQVRHVIRFSFCNLWWTWQLPYGYGWTLQQFLISTVVKLFIDDDVITSFSFSSSMSSRAAMQFRVSRNARRCAVSIRECISAPTTFTHTNTTTLPTICTKINTSLGGIHNSRSPISITNCLSSSYWRFCVCSVERMCCNAQRPLYSRVYWDWQLDRHGNLYHLLQTL